jgi:hypothetical protein
LCTEETGHSGVGNENYEMNGIMSFHNCVPMLY